MPIDQNTPLFLDPAISDAEAAGNKKLQNIQAESTRVQKKMEPHVSSINDVRFHNVKYQLLRLRREVVGCEDEPLYKAFANPELHRMYYLHFVRAYNQLAYEMALECDAVIKAGKNTSNALNRLNKLAWELEFFFRWNTGRAQDYSSVDPYDDLDHAVDQRIILSWCPPHLYISPTISTLKGKEIFKHLSKRMVGLTALAGTGVGAGLSLALLSAPAALPIIAAAVVGALAGLVIGMAIRNYKSTAVQYALEALDQADMLNKNGLNPLIKPETAQNRLSFLERHDNTSIILAELCASSRGVTKLVYGYEWKCGHLRFEDRAKNALPATRDFVRQFYYSTLTQHIRPVVAHKVPRGPHKDKTPLQVLGQFVQQHPNNNDAKILLDVWNDKSVMNAR